jgi:heptosyltransferase I
MASDLHRELEPPIRRIGVVLFGILGDTLTRTPAVRELRRLFPNAHIECFVDPIGFEALQNSPDINSFKVVIRSKKSRWRSVRSKISIYWYLLTQSYDLFVDLYGNSSSRVMTKLAWARKELIVAGGRVFAKGLTPQAEQLPFPNVHHLSNTSLQILRYFWTDQVSLSTRPVIDLESKAMTQIEKRYVDELLSRHKYFFVISAGSGDSKKMIPPKLCTSLSQYAFDRKGAVPFVLHNPGVRDIQSEISESFQRVGLKFEAIKPLGLPAVVYLLKNAAFVVVSDSGILHLTVAVGTPFLGIFPHTPPQEVVPESGIFEVSFKPDPGQRPYGSRGLVYGDSAITEGEALQRLNALMNRIEA